MRRSLHLWLLTLLMAAAAIATRVWELASAYDYATELAVSMHPATITTALIAGAAVLLLFLLRGRADPDPDKAAGSFASAVGALSGLALLGSAVFDAMRAAEKRQVSLFVFVALTLMTAFVLLRYSRQTGDGKTDPTRGFYLTIPVFWGCYWLILDFWDHAANPVLFSYLYKMLAIIFVTLALHGAAGASFGRTKARMTRLFAFGGLFFALMTIGSTQLAGLFVSPGETFSAMTLTPAALCRYIFAALHMSVTGLYAAKNTERPLKVTEPGAAEEGAADADMTDIDTIDANTNE